MADDRDAGVDPRFDPVFQRGYDPTVHGESHPRSALRHAPAAMSAEGGREPSAAGRRGTEPEQAEVGAPDAGPFEGPSAEALAIEAEPVEPEIRGRNPFQLALLLVSIASAAGAGLLLWRRFQADPYGQISYSSPTELFQSQLVESLMTPLFTGAIVGFCLWLALLAIAAGPKSGE